MKALAVFLALSLVLVAAAADPPAGAPIDRNRARELYQRQQQGEKLSPDEQAYLDRAKAERRKQNDNPGQGANPKPAPPARESTGLPPLTSKSGEYKGFSLGLYGDGQNAPPVEHLKRATDDAAKVVPLDAGGKPSP